ncbi:hypothetical protein [Streptosporangium roseum]|uniref:hypothetical protein n=1 Tax=Streptosporangium roseum TaxID=2001 RepID=UPI0004CD74FE|nr:hypothetical protein [Streptosporangium roseum]
MPEEQKPNSKGPAKVQIPVPTDRNLIPASEVKPEDMGTLSLQYVDGVPRIVVSGGKVIPAQIQVVDSSQGPLGVYSAGPSVGGEARLGAFGWLAGSYMEENAFPNAGLSDQWR